MNYKIFPAEGGFNIKYYDANDVLVKEEVQTVNDFSGLRINSNYLTLANLVVPVFDELNEKLSPLKWDSSKLVWTQTIIPLTEDEKTKIKDALTAITPKRQEFYSGTTNSEGEYTVVFNRPFDSIPNIQVSLITQVTNRNCFVKSITTTGFTVKVVQRATLTVLSIEVLAATTTNVNGANVNVTVVG